MIHVEPRAPYWITIYQFCRGLIPTQKSCYISIALLVPEYISLIVKLYDPFVELYDGHSAISPDLTSHMNISTSLNMIQDNQMRVIVINNILPNMVRHYLNIIFTKTLKMVPYQDRSGQVSPFRVNK